MSVDSHPVAFYWLYDGFYVNLYTDSYQIFRTLGVFSYSSQFTVRKEVEEDCE